MASDTVLDAANRSGLIERTAKKVVQVERQGGEKLGVWAGAALQEVAADVASLFAKPVESEQSKLQQPKKADAQPKAKDASGSSREPGAG